MTKPIEILRFLRTPANGKRVMRIRGELYESVADIPDDRVQKVIRRSIAEMVEMAGGLDVLIADGWLAAPEPPTATESITEIKETDPDLPKPEKTEHNVMFEEKGSPPKPPLVEAGFLQSIRDTPSDVDKPKSTDNSLFGRFRTLSGRQPSKPETKTPSLDIATQINRLLQAQLTQMPTFLGRQIELRSSMGGELLFIVDGRPYESLADIPDKEAVLAFRQAIADWENR